MIRRFALDQRAYNILLHGGLDGLAAWIESLPENDQYLLGDWRVYIEDEPRELELFDVCESPECGAEQVVYRAACYICGWQKEAA